VISNWRPFEQGGPPGGLRYSGLGAQVAKASGNGDIAFGQQINLPTYVAHSGTVAAVYTGNKYFGYFPLVSGGVYLGDISNPTGDSTAAGAIQPSPAILWAPSSDDGQGDGIRLRASHVSISGYDKYLLVGSNVVDDQIYVAEINPTTGMPTQTASISTPGNPTQVEIAVVNGHIYLVSAEGSGGLHFYEYDPLPSPTLTPVASIAGNIKFSEVRGPQPPQ